MPPPWLLVLIYLETFFVKAEPRSEHARMKGSIFTLKSCQRDNRFISLEEMMEQNRDEG